MKDLKEIVNFLKENGFVFSGSSIYGGLANSWDFGPLGSLLKENIKKSWRDFFINEEENDTFLLDTSIILNPSVWKTSGHIDKFNDPMIDCKNCKKRYRSDHLIEKFLKLNFDNKSNEEQTKVIKENIKCPKCKSKDWTDVKNFELMFKIQNSINFTNNHDYLYLRPETAQGIFINFKNIIDNMGVKIPFGVGQIGKSFRNEVTPGTFIFRTKEFEQLELEFFFYKDEKNKWFNYYENKIMKYLIEIGLTNENIKKDIVSIDSLAHYSSKTIDFLYKFSFGWGELLGLANRSDFDLKNHSEFSNEKLFYNDQIMKKKIIPHIIETSMGVERLFLAIISENLITEKIGENDERYVLKLPYKMAPYKLSVMPLTNKLKEQAFALYKDLLKKNIGSINFKKNGTIGKRYRKQDAIGTPYSITYDFDSEKDGKVTIRDRDKMTQNRIKISEIKKYIKNNAK